MKTKGIAVVALVLCAAACDLSSIGKALGQCIGEALGAAIGRSLGIGIVEGLQQRGRPDEASRVDGGELYVSGEVDGGRLILTFDGPPLTESLPAQHGDGGSCAPPGDFAYLYQYFGDSGTVRVLRAQLTVSPGDAGTLLQLTGVGIALEDGGADPLADRSFDLPLP